MAYKSVCTAATSMNSTETTETLIESLVVPQGVKRIVGVAAQILGGTAGETTLENVGGKFTLKSSDMTGWGGDQNFLTGAFSVVSSGGLCQPPYVHPTDIPVNASAHVDVYATMDLALTINNKVRVQVIYE